MRDGRVLCSEDARAWDEIAQAEGATQVRVGATFACARLERRVLCWGRDDWGQLSRDATLRREPRMDGKIWAMFEGICSTDIAPSFTETRSQRREAIHCIPHRASIHAHFPQPGLEVYFRGGHCEVRSDQRVHCVQRDQSVTSPRIESSQEESTRARTRILTGRLSVCTTNTQPPSCLYLPRFEAGFQEIASFPSDATSLIEDPYGLCVLRPDHSLWCTDSDYRQESPHSAAPFQRADIPEVEEIRAGVQQRCARLQSGAVECWDSDDLHASTRRPVPLGFVAEELVASFGHFCARSNQQTACWGRGELGQLDGTPRFQNREVRFVNAPPFVKLAVSETLSCGQTEDQQVWCWGMRPTERVDSSPVLVPE